MFCQGGFFLFLFRSSSPADPTASSTPPHCAAGLPQVQKVQQDARRRQLPRARGENGASAWKKEERIAGEKRSRAFVLFARPPPAHLAHPPARAPALAFACAAQNEPYCQKPCYEVGPAALLFIAHPQTGPLPCARFHDSPLTRCSFIFFRRSLARADMVTAAPSLTSTRRSPPCPVVSCGGGIAASHRVRPATQ